MTTARQAQPSYSAGRGRRSAQPALQHLTVLSAAKVLRTISKSDPIHFCRKSKRENLKEEKMKARAMLCGVCGVFKFANL